MCLRIVLLDHCRTQPLPVLLHTPPPPPGACVRAVDLQSKLAAGSGKKTVTGKEFNAYLAANKVRHRSSLSIV